MMDSDYTIQNLIESAITLPDIISCLVGMLISLVAYKFEFLGKKAWFGNAVQELYKHVEKELRN